LNRISTWLLATLVVASVVGLGACGSEDVQSNSGEPAQIAAAELLSGESTPEPDISSEPTTSPDATAIGSSATTVATTVESPVSSAVEATTSVATLSEAAEDATVTGLVDRLGDEAWDELVILTEEYSPRTSATEQEKAAADYLVAKFRSMGYDAELQPFTIELLSPEFPVLQVASPTPHQILAFPMTESGRGRTSGTLVDVGGAFESDVEPGSLEGKIALIERGDITFQEKVDRVADAGAVAAIVYNNVSGGFSGRLAKPSGIPAVAISRQDGIATRSLARTGTATAEVAVVYESHGTWNVIAEKPAAGNGDGVVVLGGHYDTVPDVPGANDNGSGIATLLTIAREISDRSYPFTLLFIPFGSEEVGLLGSKHYVESLTEDEQRNILAMLNFDALATGPITGVLGNFSLTDKLVDYGRENEINVQSRATLGLDGGSSDHASFAAVDIPVVFFLADDFSRIHTIDDKLEFVQRELMGSSAALAVGLLDILDEG